MPQDHHHDQSCIKEMSCGVLSTCFSRAQRFSCMRLLFCSASSMAASLTAIALAGRFFTDALPLASLVTEPAFAGLTGDFGCFLPIEH